jgi:hypothetical protein
MVHLDASLDGFGRSPTRGEPKVALEIATLRLLSEGPILSRQLPT